MARHIANLTADGRSTAFPMYQARSGGDSSLKEIYVQGTFGSGTATLQVSADGGTTWVDATDDNGTSITFAANGVRNVQISSDAQAPVLISINLAGSTSPDLNLIIFENR